MKTESKKRGSQTKKSFGNSWLESLPSFILKKFLREKADPIFGFHVFPEGLRELGKSKTNLKIPATIAQCIQISMPYAVIAQAKTLAAIITKPNKRQ